MKYQEYQSLARKVGRLLADKEDIIFSSEFKSLLSEYDEKTIVSFINQHHLANVVYHKLKDTGISDLSGLRNTLCALSLIGSRNRSHIDNAINILVELLRKEQIRFIMVKGVSIEHYAYPFVKRNFNDIDLLIDPYSKERFECLMIKYGGKINLSKHVVPSSEILFEGVLIDAHYDSFFADFHYLYPRSVSISYGSVELSILTAEDLFLYVCCHLSFVHRYWPLLSWIYDVYRLIKTGKIDWRYVKYIGQKMGVLSMIKHSLGLTDYFMSEAMDRPLDKYVRFPFEPGYNSLWKGNQDSRLMTELSLLSAHKDFSRMFNLYSRRLFYRFFSLVEGMY
ncbi:MAG: nucleotidyltransferase family protein [Planctomycetes bacterium]|nr:nucleotidyltransferase family protein [Planctomycetota bacterium]